MSCDAFDIGILLHKGLEDLVLLLVRRLQRNSVLIVSLGGIVVILIKVVGLNAEEHVHIGKAFRAEIPCLVPCPEKASEVSVKADFKSHLLCCLHQADHKLRAAFTKGRRNAAQMKPVKSFQQFSSIDLRKIIFCDRAVLAVICNFTGTDPVAGLQVIRSQPVGRRLLFVGEDHRRAVHVIASKHADRALAEGIVGHHCKEGTVHTQICQCQRNIGFTSAIACVKTVRDADLAVIGRRKPQHDLAKCNKLLSAVLCQQRVFVNHIHPPHNMVAVLFPAYRNTGVKYCRTAPAGILSSSPRSHRPCFPKLYEYKAFSLL